MARENPAFRIIEKSVNRITAAMLSGKFSKEDLETIKKIFQEGIRATEDCLERGPGGTDESVS